MESHGDFPTESLPLLQESQHDKDIASSDISYDHEAVVPASSTASPSTPETNDSYHEYMRLFRIAFPTVAVSFFGFFLNPQAASVVGRNLGTRPLGALSLGTLLGNMTCFSIITGTLNASETLQPRAYGLGHHREVARLAIRGFVICSMYLSVSLVLLVMYDQWILTVTGQEPATTQLATEWISVYLWSVPSLLLFKVVQRFLACQGVVAPCVYGAGFACLIVQPTALHWAVGKMGFLGSAWAMTISQTASVVSTMGILHFVGHYDKATWPGWSLSLIREALAWEDILVYAKLSFAGVFALGEWWFWEAICLIAGKFGTIPLCIHTVAYQIIPISFMIPLGISIAMTVRMGILLPIDVKKTKLMVVRTTIFSIIVGTIVSVFVYVYQTWIVSLFTTDEKVFEGCREIWLYVCLVNLLGFVFPMFIAALSALGLQWITAATMITTLWLISIPTILWFSVHRGGGLYLMWQLLPVSYTLLSIALLVCLVTADWQAIADEIRTKSEKTMVIDAELIAKEEGTTHDKEAHSCQDALASTDHNI